MDSPLGLNGGETSSDHSLQLSCQTSKIDAWTIQAAKPLAVRDKRSAAQRPCWKE
jgi:hypothetical protein